MNKTAAEGIANALLAQAYMERVRCAPLGQLVGDVFVNGDMLVPLVGCPAAVILWHERGKPDVEVAWMRTADGYPLEVTAPWCIASKEQELWGLQFVRDRGLEPGLCRSFLAGELGPFMVLGVVTDWCLFAPQYADDLTSDVARKLFSSEFVCPCECIALTSMAQARRLMESQGDWREDCRESS